MATISTSGIASGSIIRAEHVLRVIESLSGDDANDILISGSVGITGSFTITSGSITKTEAGDRPGVAKHLYVSDEGTEKLQKYIDTLIVEYNKLYPNYFKNIEVLNKSCPLWLGRPWYNYQKKNEYIPVWYLHFSIPTANPIKS